MSHHEDGDLEVDTTTFLRQKRGELKSIDSVSEYSGLANRTLADDVRDNSIIDDWPSNAAMVLNAALGIGSESGEVLEIVKKWLFHHHVMDEATLTHLKKELGDKMWYWALMCYAMRIDPAEVLATNIEKLRARYPDGFSVERSIHRDPNDI